jgi:hypothetical protein
LLGITHEATRRPPGTADDDSLNARTGEQVRYHGPFQECKLILGCTTTFGQLLTATTGGNGTPVTPSANGALATAAFVGALSLGNGVTGDKVNVWVLPPFQVHGTVG